MEDKGFINCSVCGTTMRKSKQQRYEGFVELWCPNCRNGWAPEVSEYENSRNPELEGLCYACNQPPKDSTLDRTVWAVVGKKKGRPFLFVHESEAKRQAAMRDDLTAMLVTVHGQKVEEE